MASGLCPCAFPLPSSTYLSGSSYARARIKWSAHQARMAHKRDRATQQRDIDEQLLAFTSSGRARAPDEIQQCVSVDVCLASLLASLGANGYINVSEAAIEHVLYEVAGLPRGRRAPLLQLVRANGTTRGGAASVRVSTLSSVTSVRAALLSSGAAARFRHRARGERLGSGGWGRGAGGGDGVEGGVIVHRTRVFQTSHLGYYLP